MLSQRGRASRAWVVVALVGLACGGVLSAQGVESEELSADTLRRDVRFLQMLANLGVTAEQRAQVATAIEACQQKQEAIRKLSEPPELLTALNAMREALLKGETPTDKMREAVEAAQPPDDGSADHAFGEARDEALTALKAALTDDQKQQLAIMPLVGLAEDVITMSLQSRDAPEAEAQEMRLHSFSEIRGQLAEAAGADSDRVLNDLQGLINRIAALTPEQAEQQHQQLVGQIVTLLKTTFDKQPDIMSERLDDQLWGWVAEPRVGKLFRESAEAMGAK